MRRVIACGAYVWMLAACSLSAEAAGKGDQNRGSLVGKKVIAIRPEVVLRLQPADDARGADFTPSCNPMRIVEEREQWLGSTHYWIRRADVVPLSDALECFTKQLERSPTAYAHVARSRVWRIEKHDLEKALADAEAAVRLDPTFALTWISRGECRNEQELYAEAIADFTRALEIDPQLRSALSDRVKARYQTEDFDGAIADCTAGLTQWPSYLYLAELRAMAHVKRGLLARARRRFDLADRDFTSAIEDLRIQRRSAALQNSGTPPPKSSADSRYELDNIISGVYVYRADVRFCSSQRDAAIADCNEAIRLGSKNPTAYLLRGLALRELSDSQEAIRDFEEAIRLDPNFGPAYVRLSDTHCNLGDHDRAIHCLTQAMELIGKSAELLSARGRAKYWGGAFRAAEQDFSDAIELDPDNAETYNWRGEAYVELHDREAAMKDYDNALKFDPLNKYARVNRAELFYEMGDLEKAIADCTSALVSDPDWFQPRYLRGSIYASLGYHREALNDLTRSATLNPIHASTYMNRAQVWDEVNESEKAIEDLNTVIRIRPDDPRAYRRRGEIFKSAGNNEDAARDFAEAERLESLERTEAKKHKALR